MVTMYILLFHGNNGYANAPQYYVTVPVLNQAPTILKDKQHCCCITILKGDCGPTVDCEVPAEGVNKMS
jgi:hypothetical protein